MRATRAKVRTSKEEQGRAREGEGGWWRSEGELAVGLRKSRRRGTGVKSEQGGAGRRRGEAVREAANGERKGKAVNERKGGEVKGGRGGARSREAKANVRS